MSDEPERTRRDERRELIEQLEAARDGRTVLAYVTSTRNNLESQMAVDVIPVIYRHLEALTTSPAETRIDLFIHSNGGDGIVPWRLVTLLREFCREFNVLVPHRAFSAATLTALGADCVVMHPMGMLGPTDPTVANRFNPPDPQNPKQLLGISVEDVSSYISLVKHDVGIHHEDELVQAFNMLAEKIHPLALGNVKRATSQSRMLASKLLRQKAGEPKIDERELDEIVEKLTSQLYFHGHPINRQEAREDLRLGFVRDASQDEESAMWALYEAYATDMRLDEDFQPLQEVYARNPIDTPPAPQMAGPGQLGATTINTASDKVGPLSAAYVESTARCDVNIAEFDVTIRKDWLGELAATASLVRSGWEEES
jgi:hypothetical protein